MEFNQNDIAQMKSRGSDPEYVTKQFAFFERGFDFSLLDRPATVGDGILVLEESKIFNLADHFYQKVEDRKLLKFVPASGAASRMFKDLFSFLEAKDNIVEQKAIDFLSKIKKFAFKNELEEVLQRDGYSLYSEIREQNYKLIISYILDEKGLNYANLPKGLLQFHIYPAEIRTAIEEHLVEGALYAQNRNKTCCLHFTVSSHHQKLFEELIKQVKKKYEKRFGITYKINFSIQEPSTDTLAADINNRPFRDSSGKLLFRPGGHGALIDNLGHLEYDLIFIKNIDNTVPDYAKASTILYKKALGSYLLELQNQIFSYLQKIERQEFSTELLSQILTFIKEKLAFEFSSEFENHSEKEKWSFLYAKLNRPLRICGMVKNMGEIGGGPFWVRNPKGEKTLQIVETSQINLKDQQQREILQRSTYFNPVDLVCSFRNYKGEYFALQNYVDKNSGFISLKSYEGKTLKAMELPGLWNGAMADWITVFVEVPLETFNPVKTIFDLLKR